MTEPTYTALQVKEMCKQADFDFDSYTILAELIEKEIELYSPDDLMILAQASVIALNRGLINKFFKR